MGSFLLFLHICYKKNPEGAFLYKHFKLGGKTIKFFEDKKKFASQYGALVRGCSTFSTFRVTKVLARTKQTISIAIALLLWRYVHVLRSVLVLLAHTTIDKSNHAQPK